MQPRRDVHYISNRPQLRRSASGPFSSGRGFSIPLILGLAAPPLYPSISLRFWQSAPRPYRSPLCITRAANDSSGDFLSQSCQFCPGLLKEPLELASHSAPSTIPTDTLDSLQLAPQRCLAACLHQPPALELWSMPAKLSLSPPVSKMWSKVWSRLAAGNVPLG